MDAPTIFSVLFVIILVLMGLQFIFSTCYRTPKLIKLAIKARRYSSALWFRAYEANDPQVRERLFDWSHKIDSYATVIQENRVAIGDFDVWFEEMQRDMCDTDKPIEQWTSAQRILGVEYFCGQIFLFYVLSSALCAKYPLVYMFFFVIGKLLAFLAPQWKGIKKVFDFPIVYDVNQRPVLVTTSHSISGSATYRGAAQG